MVMFEKFVQHQHQRLGVFAYQADLRGGDTGGFEVVAECADGARAVGSDG